MARFDGSGIEEVGRFIDQGGNDFWGVQLADTLRRRPPGLAYSDRDYGIYLATYTGP